MKGRFTMRSTIASSLSLVGLIFLVARCGGTTTPEPDGGSGSSTDSGSGSKDGGGGGGGDGGGGSCSPACGQTRTCCGSACVNTDNDPHNCGGCGVTCTGSKSYCGSGTCTEPPCTRPGGSCDADGGSGSCCGSQCCGAGQLCCADEGPVSGEPTCFSPTAEQPTCPQGCAPLCVSDRNAKTNITPVSDRDVLDALASVPMSTWSYKTDDPSVRHLGPMAQDLHAAFGLGATDRAYDPIDAHGIAFASVKALYEIVKEQDARIDRLEADNARLDAACGRASPTKSTDAARGSTRATRR